MTQVDPEIAAFLKEDENRETVNYDDLANMDEGSPLPVLGETTVELPGGFLSPEAGLVTTATVKELTGYDEEQLARADIKKPIDYLNRLLLLGVKEIGGSKLNDAGLRGMLIGDRNALIIGIRQATFGNELSMDGVTCPECNEMFDIHLGLDEFESKRLSDPIEDRTFRIQLRNKRMATLRLATHGDVCDMLTSSKVPDQNTSLLAHCLVGLDGVKPEVLQEHTGSTEVVRGLNMRDRQVLLDELRKRQPGPDLTGVKISCPHCDYEDRIGLDLISLFRI